MYNGYTFAHFLSHIHFSTNDIDFKEHFKRLPFDIKK